MMILLAIIGIILLLAGAFLTLLDVIDKPLDVKFRGVIVAVIGIVLIVYAVAN